MGVDICPKTPKCPIFNDILKGTEYTDTYKSYIVRLVKPGEISVEDTRSQQR